MDCRNGGDFLAPPRPPKLLPRIHRPPAPDPTTTTTTMNSNEVALTTLTTVERGATSSSTITITPATAFIIRRTPPPPPQQSTNSEHSSSHHQQHQSITNQCGSSVTTSAIQQFHHEDGGGTSHSNNNHTINSNNSLAVILTEPEIEEYPTHHLTYLPQRASSLSRNGSHLSNNSTSTTSSIAANSFTRRRLLPATPASASSSSVRSSSPVIPLFQITSPSSSSTSNSGAPSSPVTLAQPRPESERLSNEYVDTPLRANPQFQLQHASRVQHPAGEQDDGQTTTHHLLLLPQRELRQQFLQHQQQQQQQQLQHSTNRVAGTAGSANASTVSTTTGIDGTDGFIHSHHKTTQMSSVAAQRLAGSPHDSPLSIFSASSVSNSQGQQAPITKQPASLSNNCKNAKDLNGLDELLEVHHISRGADMSPIRLLSSPHHGSQHLGTPILVGARSPTSMSNITCPRCDRCRCEQCQSPSNLPERWICDKTCLCSAEAVIDYVSCLCCAKALFYHCARDNDMDYDDGSGTPCVDNPCSCGPYKRTQRWGWLGALSLVLPCLLCYWPLKGCVSLCEKCYGGMGGRGCHCHQIGSTASMVPNIPLSGMAHHDNDQSIINIRNEEADEVMSKTMSPHRSHLECSQNNSPQRNCKLTPKKRLLDSNSEF